jgi:hypothetical protein
MTYFQSPSDATADMKIGFGQLRGINGLKILNSFTSEHFSRQWLVGRILKQVQEE